MRIALRLPTRAGRDLLERSLDPFARVRVLQLDAAVRRTGGFGAAQRPDGLSPLPDDLLYADAPRRLYEAGAAPAYVMAQMGSHRREPRARGLREGDGAEARHRRAHGRARQGR